MISHKETYLFKPAIELMKKLLLSLLLTYSAITQAQSWTELGDSLNANGYILSIATDPSGNMYVGGLFTKASEEYVAKWDGTTWSKLGTGANALNADGGIYSMFSDTSGNIYAAGGFRNTNGKQYVAKWNGTTWAELGIGTNALNANKSIQSIAHDAAGNIYAAGYFENENEKHYVAKWDGTTWTELGTGTNALNASDPLLESGDISSITIDPTGNIYAAGGFKNENGFRYVAKWNGSTWAELGTGSNALNANGTIFSIFSDTAGNIYAAGNFTNTNGKWYVAKWNGTTWTELGTGANALNANTQINSITSDTAGNMYVAGFFTNINGNYYVAQWNGTTWAELGTGADALNAIDPIWSILPDAAGNMYAIGGSSFVDETERHFVAKYGNITTCIIDNNILSNSLQLFPNPSNSTFNISLDHVSHIEIQVDNILSQTVEKLESDGSSFSFGSQLSAGIYFVSVLENGKSSTFKIIKE